MTAKKGALLLLKVGDGAVTENFTTVGGLQLSQMALNHTVMNSSSIGEGPWRQLLDGAGMRALRIQGMGIFTDSESEAVVRALAFSGQARNFRLVFGNGDYVQGGFMVSAYSHNGPYDDAQSYAMQLESVDAVSYVAA